MRQIYSKFETRNYTQEICLRSKPSRFDHAYSGTLLSINLEDLQAGFMRVLRYFLSLLIRITTKKTVRSKARVRSKTMARVPSAGPLGEGEKSSDCWVRLFELTAGKHRHSIVRMAKGLRDRTVRLSDP